MNESSNTPVTMRFAETARALERVGFEQVRQPAATSSSGDRDRAVAPRLAPGTLRSTLRQADLAVDELVRLL